MNKFNINDDAFFIDFYNFKLSVKCMRIRTITATKYEDLRYEGSVYDYDPDTQKLYIWEESEWVSICENHLFNTKEDALNNLKNQLEEVA